MDPDHYRYAAYGSNLHPTRLQKRVPSARLLGTSAAADYEMRFNKTSDVDGSGKCSINVGKDIVYLAIFEIANKDRPVLDRIEGLGNGYNQGSVSTPEFGVCSTYVAAPSVIDDSLQPMDWYKEMVLLGCRVNNFPAQYVDRIARVRAIADPDEVRAQANWEIVEALRQHS